MIALRAAAAAAGNYRLTGATMYVTVEPCLMCVGAMVHARIGLRRVWRAGAQGRRNSIDDAGARARGLNHRLDVLGGVLDVESRDLLQAFFKDRRVSARCGDPE